MFDDSPAEEERDPVAFCALARVEADDNGAASLEIVTLPSPDGQSTMIVGMKVDVTIVAGPFLGARVSAQMCAPLGASTPTPPLAGQIVMLMMPSGTVEGGCFAVGSVLGGTFSPIKPAIAGVDISDPESLAGAQVNAPEKGVNIITYMRRATWGLRLKGLSDDANSALEISASDGAAIRLVWDKDSQGYAIKARDAKGAFVQIKDGDISVQSPNAENGIYVTDDEVRIAASKFSVTATDTVMVDGGAVMINMATIPLPVAATNGVAVGVVGPANVVSQSVFVGGLP